MKLKNILVASGLIVSMMLAGCATETNETTEATTTETVIDTTVADTISETAAETTAADSNQATEETEALVVDFGAISITSNNNTNGVWDTKITNTTNGENVSPELSWSAVDGASMYAVYMIDLDASWLHLMAYTTDTSFAEGQIDGTEGNKYVGPYPPSGTHNYVIYVIALKGEPGEVRTHYDSGYNNINKFAEQLDIDVNGNSGNVICAGMLEGTYTAGD